MKVAAQHWKQESTIAVQTAVEAGKLLLEYYEHGAEVRYKPGDEPVTEADHAASNFILTALGNAFPNDVLVSEEGADNPDRFRAERFWLIDPLDGTKEFIARNGEFSVMIGFVVDNQPVVGAVYQPTLDRLWWTDGVDAFERTGGAAARKLRVSAKQDFSAMRMVVSRSHRNALVDTLAERIGITQEIVSGSGGIKLGLIAGGNAEVMFSPTPYSKLWDLCGPEAILRAAGGTVTDFLGIPLDYRSPEVRNLNGVLASNGQRHHDLIAAAVGLFPTAH